MRIKHWQGYGSVNASVVRRITVSAKHNIKSILIKVSGNHEYGLVRNDYYDVFRWLLKRFDKQVQDDRQIMNIDIESGYDSNDVEYAYYTIVYRGGL